MEEWSEVGAKGRRTDALDRLRVEEEERTKLAARALVVLKSSGLIGGPTTKGEIDDKVFLTRLLKGLRLGTLKLWVQSAERAWRWVVAAERGRWFQEPAEIEEYLSDLATQSRAGVSTYERARFGILYLESAAGLLPEGGP